MKFFLSCSSCIPSALQKCQTLRIVFHQHVVQVQRGWGQYWLPYDTCPSYPVSSSGESAKNLRRLTTPKSHCKRQSPWQSHPRAKSMASDLKADRDSTSLIFLSAGWQHVDDLGNRGSSKGALRMITSHKSWRLPFHNQSGAIGRVFWQPPAAAQSRLWSEFPPGSAAKRRPHSLSRSQLW